MLVIVVGLAAVSIVALVSLLLYPVANVNNFDQVKGIVDRYLARISSDLRVKEIEEWSNNFYVVVQEKNTGINARA